MLVLSLVSSDQVKYHSTLKAVCQEVTNNVKVLQRWLLEP